MDGAAPSSHEPVDVHDPDAVARFNREASNASRITHPNVCAIYDFGETPTPHLPRMEFIEESRSQTSWIAKARCRARAVGSSCRSPTRCRPRTISHRAPRPEARQHHARPEKSGDQVKVVDFGIAKAVGRRTVKSDEDGTRRRHAGVHEPEQLSGDTLDGRSDLYSLALVFYRMLRGSCLSKRTACRRR